jgi:type I restriction enzyme S subunit
VTSGNGRLPSGWIQQAGSDLFTFVTSGSRGWAKYYSDGGPLFLRIGNLDRGTIALDLRDIQRVTPPDGAEGLRTRVVPGDILVSITADLGSVAVVPTGLGEAFINQHIALARPREGANSRYIAWFIVSPEGQKQLMALQRGATKKGLGLDDIRSLRVPSAPSVEQESIVAEVEKQFTRLDAGVEALRRLQAHLRRYRAGVLNAACEGRLVPNEADVARAEGRNFESGATLLERTLAARKSRWLSLFPGKRYVEPDHANTEGMPPLPDGWAWATAEQLSDETRSITYGVIKLGEPVESGVPTLRSSDVRHLRLDLEGVKRIAPEIAQNYRRTFLEGGELLVTVRGTLGGIVVAPPFVKGFNVSREVAVIVPVDMRLASCAAVCIASPRIQSWLKRRAKGIAYTGVNIETLKQMPVPLPPLDEQKRIVSKVEQLLSETDAVSQVVAHSVARSARMRVAVLRSAFEGRLVPQDASDTPSSLVTSGLAQSEPTLDPRPRRKRVPA